MTSWESVRDDKRNRIKSAIETVMGIAMLSAIMFGFFLSCVGIYMGLTHPREGIEMGVSIITFTSYVTVIVFSNIKAIMKHKWKSIDISRTSDDELESEPAFNEQDIVDRLSEN